MLWRIVACRRPTLSTSKFSVRWLRMPCSVVPLHIVGGPRVAGAQALACCG
jgi:hypothetical protein